MVCAGYFPPASPNSPAFGSLRHLLGAGRLRKTPGANHSISDLIFFLFPLFFSISISFILYFSFYNLHSSFVIYYLFTPQSPARTLSASAAGCRGR